MKKNNLITGIIYTAAGIIFLIAATQIGGKLDSLFFGFSGVATAAGIMILCKYFYWNRPGNKDRYKERLETEKIALNDELNIKLRDKSGRCAYTAGLIVNCIAVVIFYILGALELIADSRTIVLYLGALILFQVILYIAFFYRLRQNYQ